MNWRDLVDEHNALDILELRDRVRDLASDNRALRETLRASVDLNHTLTEQNARLRICLRRNLWEIYGAVIGRAA